MKRPNKIKVSAHKNSLRAKNYEFTKKLLSSLKWCNKGWIFLTAHLTEWNGQLSSSMIISFHALRHFLTNVLYTALLYTETGINLVRVYYIRLYIRC